MAKGEAAAPQLPPAALQRLLRHHPKLHPESAAAAEFQALGLGNLPFLQWDVAQPWGRFLESPIPVDLEEPASPTAVIFPPSPRLERAPAEEVPGATSAEACAACGNILMADAVFCRKCGAKRTPVSQVPLTETFELSASGTQLRSRGGALGNAGEIATSPSALAAEPSATSAAEDAADSTLAALAAEEAELMREVNSLDAEAARIGASVADASARAGADTNGVAVADHSPAVVISGSGLEDGVAEAHDPAVASAAAARHQRQRLGQPGRSSRAGQGGYGSARAPRRAAPSQAQQQEDQALTEIAAEEALLLAELGGLEARLAPGSDANLQSVTPMGVAEAAPTPGPAAAASPGHSNVSASPPQPPPRRNSPAPPKATGRQQRPPRPPKPPPLA